MKTFNLEEAAQFLKMNPEGLRRLAASKKIPAGKPGKCWYFLEEDLVNYLLFSIHFQSTLQNIAGCLTQ